MRLFAADEAARVQLSALGVLGEPPEPPWDDAVAVLAGEDAWTRVRAWRAAGHRHRVLLLGQPSQPGAWALEPLEQLIEVRAQSLQVALGRLARRRVLHRVLLEHGVVDLAARTFRSTQGRTVRLSPNERGLLAYLSAQPGVEVGRDELAVQVWGKLGGRAAHRAIEAAVSRLRKKIEATPTHPRSLLLGPDGGYLLRLASPLRPVQVHTPFVERPELMAALRRAPANEPLALVGPPGAGKTRLAMVWVDELPLGSSVWLDASGVVDLDQALHRLASRWGVEQTALAELLATWSIHTVLYDGADDLGPSALSELAERLRPARLVVTRQAHLDGMRCVVVGPLSREQAAQLVRLRGAPTVAGGSVLELELGTAGRGSTRDAIERLEPASRRVLEACATFGGLFDRERLATVFPSVSQAGLDALAERHLVQPTPAGWRVLDAVREACRVPLELRLAHARWLADEVGQLWPRLDDEALEPLATLRALDVELDQALRFARHAAGETLPLLTVGARVLRLATGDVQGAAALVEALEPVERTREDPVVAWLHGQRWLNLDRARAVSSLERAEEQADTGWLQASARLDRSRTLAWHRGPAAALALVEPWPYPEQRALALGARVHARVLRRAELGYRTLAESLRPLVRELARMRCFGEAIRAATWHQLALHYAGAPDQALRQSERCAHWLAVVPHLGLASSYDQNAGVFAHALGRTELAIRLQARANRAARGRGRELRGELMLALLRLHQGQLGLARGPIERFCGWARATGQARDEAQGRELLAVIFLELDQLERARWEAEEALALAPDPPSRAGPLLALATARFLAGERQAALELVESIDEGSLTMRRRVETLGRRYAMSRDAVFLEVLRELGRTSPAAEGLRETLALFGPPSDEASEVRGGYGTRLTARVLGA